MRCAVLNCASDSGGKACSISFFKIPTNPALKKKWINFCGRGKNLNPRSNICMLHFKPEDIENRLQFDMGFAKQRLLKRDAVPTIKTGSFGNEDLFEERAARIEKRENKKLVELILQAHEAEEKAKLREETELNDGENRKFPDCDVAEILIQSVTPTSDLINENDFDTNCAHAEGAQQPLKNNATQTKINNGFACALVMATRNFMTFNVSCFFCDACFSLRDWDKLMIHVSRQHRQKMESYFQNANVDETKKHTLGVLEEDVFELKSKGFIFMIQNVPDKRKRILGGARGASKKPKK